MIFENVRYFGADCCFHFGDVYVEDRKFEKS